jgi:hypothetical protein
LFVGIGHCQDCKKRGWGHETSTALCDVLRCVAGATTAAFSQEMKTDYDHHANFAEYKTYSWAKVEIPDPLWNDRVKKAVDRQVADKGWTEVANGGDVSIVAVGTTHERPTLQTFYDGFDGWMWGASKMQLQQPLWRPTK